jgi:hypothetical protein
MWCDILSLGVPLHYPWIVILGQAGENFEKPSNPFAASSRVPCTGRYPSYNEQTEVAHLSYRTSCSALDSKNFKAAESIDIFKDIAARKSRMPRSSKTSRFQVLKTKDLGDLILY